LHECLDVFNRFRHLLLVLYLENNHLPIVGIFVAYLRFQHKMRRKISLR